ncbi:helix-turn-helix domain-containing protein [Streptomyces vinaceus]|uniref:helix-turn-helix domain-containing protein n=1 Tax=Streptomyces vinaceus TaxID=1960 RepID=UPI0036AAC24B
MRGTDHNESRGGNDAAARFGALVRQLAIEAKYDLTPNAGGKAQLARDTGMSASSVGRMLDGKTLPLPHQFETIARVLKADVRTLLVSSGVISSQSWPKSAIPDVLSATTQSQPLSPEAAADMWGITEPNIRAMLIGNIQQAIRLQNEADDRRDDRGAAVGRR